MDSIREKIVTAASLRRPQKQISESEAAPEAQTPEAQLKQAQYDQIMRRLQQAADEAESDVMITVQDREVSLAQSKIAEQATSARALASGGQEVQFGTGLSGGDWLRWMWSLTDWVSRNDAHPIVRPSSPDSIALAGDAMVGITADWGTGLYGAPRIADSIRTMAQSRKFDLLMHLGDVYYSGTKKEVEERFLKIWPSEAATLNRALNGNHEMYSGGFGYFQLILPPLQQASSYFALHNDNWVLVGLDTAYVDHDLDTTQVAWLNVVLSQLQAKTKRKVVLFSHHQPYSRLDHKGQGPKLQKALAHLFDDEVITAWYFGHEHQCIIYDRHPEWGFYARCLGHGGIPEARKAIVKDAPEDPANPGGAGCTWRRLEANADAPGCIALDGPNMDMKKKSDQEKFSPHGYMTLEFKGDSLIERVVSSDGTVIFTNTIK